MKNSLISTSIVALVALTVLGALSSPVSQVISGAQASGSSQGDVWMRFLVSAVGAFAFVFGAWCAPAGYGGAGMSGTLFTPLRRWTDAERSTKVKQIAIGAVVVYVASLLGVTTGVDAIIGIVAAMFVGALLHPRNAQESDDAPTA